MRLTRPGRLGVMAVTVIAVLALTVSGVIAQGRPAMLGGVRPSRGSVAISGDVLHRLVLDARDLNALPRQTVQVTYFAGGVREHHVFRGPRLIDVIGKAHPLFDSAIKNDKLRFYVSVTGSDGYSVLVAYGEIDPKFEGKDVLLATTEDGHPLGTAGPRLVVPGDKAGGRYVSGVVSVQLGSSNQPNLTVSAADALTTAFTKYATQFSAANVKFSFAGAAELAMQIQKGARPDIFASSNTSLPDMLHAEGLVSKPVVFAADRLVIAVPAGSTTVRSVADLGKPGVKLAIGSASTPVGADALAVLSHLPAAERSAILANVTFTGSGGSAVVTEVASKGVDAGFLLGDDVAGSSGKLTAIQLPSNDKPQVAAFGVAVVKGSKHPGQAQAFIDGLLTAPGQEDLLQAGFDAPSKP